MINAGLRFDYFDSNGEIPNDPEDPNVFNPQKLINRYRDLDGDGVISAGEISDENLTTLEERQAYWYTSASPKIQISPRLGVAYPITTQGVIHFSYGYFFQIPTYEFLFQNPGFRVGTLSGTYGPYGNPDLEPQRTVMYEIGLQQGFGDDFLLDVTGFYRDIEDWVSVGFPTERRAAGRELLRVRRTSTSPTSAGSQWPLGKRFNGRFSFDVDYTYQLAEGSNSDPNDAVASRSGADDAPRLQHDPAQLGPAPHAQSQRVRRRRRLGRLRDRPIRRRLPVHA